MQRRPEIPEVCFPADHYERGLLRGRMLRATLHVPHSPHLPRSFVTGCRRAACDLHPPVLQEFTGLLEAGGFERERMEAYYFARLEARLGGCTMFGLEPGAHAAGRGPLIGRNYDWAVADLRWCRLHRFARGESPARLGYTHHWAGCPDVLNEHGLYLAIASLPAVAVSVPGVQWSVLVEMISETCRLVDEAVAVCARVQHLRPMSYLFADAEGGLAVVEATPAAVRVRRPGGGLIVAANHPQGGRELGRASHGGQCTVLEQPCDRGSAARGKAHRRSLRRVQRVAEMIGHGHEAVTAERVAEVLRDHEAPVCTGNHGSRDGGRWATIWSGICRPAQDDFRIAPGLPCRHDYQRLATRTG